MVQSIQKVVGVVSPLSIAFAIAAIAATWKWLKSNSPQRQPVLVPVSE